MPLHLLQHFPTLQTNSTQIFIRQDFFQTWCIHSVYVYICLVIYFIMQSVCPRIFFNTFPLFRPAIYIYSFGGICPNYGVYIGCVCIYIYTYRFHNVCRMPPHLLQHFPLFRHTICVFSFGGIFSNVVYICMCICTCILKYFIIYEVCPHISCNTFPVFRPIICVLSFGGIFPNMVYVFNVYIYVNV